MGRRGPAPTPTALRVLRGNPGRRPLNHDEPTPTPVEAGSPESACPDHLNGEAAALWERVAPNAIAIGLITIADLAHLEGYCVAYGRWRQAEAESDKLGLELAIAKGYRNAAVKERQLMLQYGARLGFDPSSRSNVKLAPREKESKADAFRRQKGGAA